MESLIMISSALKWSWRHIIIIYVQSEWEFIYTEWQAIYSWILNCNLFLHLFWNIKMCPKRRKLCNWDWYPFFRKIPFRLPFRHFNYGSKNMCINRFRRMFYDKYKRRVWLVSIANFGGDSAGKAIILKV